MRESTEITEKSPAEILELKNTVKETKSATESVTGDFVKQKRAGNWKTSNLRL